jgi:hypothetical protein
VGASAVTAPGALSRHQQERPDAPAMRFKHRGRWRVWTWGAFGREVNALARGLLAVGLRPGDRLGLVGAPSPRQLAMRIAAEQIGGAVVPLDVARAPASAGATGAGSAAEIVFAQGRGAAERLDRLLSERSAAAAPRVIILDDLPAPRATGDARLRSYQSLRVGAAGLGAAEVEVAVAVAVDNPGRAEHGGRPAAPSPLRLQDRALFLPGAWPDGGRSVVRVWVETGFVLGFPERDGNLDVDIGELDPTALLGPATAIGDLVGQALDRLPRPGTWRRTVLDRSLERAERPARPGALARALVWQPLRRALGWRSLRLVSTIDAIVPSRARALLEALEIATVSLPASSERSLPPRLIHAAGASPAEPARGVA